MNKYFYTYVVYLTNPKSNLYNHIYFGQHITSNLNDGYIGSGKLLTRYLKKYPNDYYRKILRLYNSEEELNKAEYNLILLHLNKEYCLNLCGGGLNHIASDSLKCQLSKSHKGKKLSEEHRSKISESNKGRQVSEVTRQKISKANKGKKLTTEAWNKGKYFSDESKKKMSESHKGKKFSEETKKKMSESHKGKNLGSLNGMYNNHEFKDSVWVHDKNNNNTRVKIKDLDSILNQGYIRGMIKK